MAVQALTQMPLEAAASTTGGQTQRTRTVRWSGWLLQSNTQIELDIISLFFYRDWEIIRIRMDIHFGI